MEEQVILVDDTDLPLGAMEKLEAHRSGLLHRAFSIFIFSPDRQCLIQRRAEGKYHSAGLWSNACCSHPRPGEAMDAAVGRRLHEELGVTCDLEKVFETRYDLDVGAGLREAEYNHTYLGMLETGAALTPDPDECSACLWKPADDIENDLAARPETYTAWFVLLFPKVIRLLPP